MIRLTWLSLARSSWRSLLCRLAGMRAAQRHRRRAARFLRLRRNQFTLGPVAAELCEPRQLLSAAITAVSPNSGSVNGGTTVNIMGSGFQSGVMGIDFGSTMVSSYQILSDSAISAIAPAHFAGTVDIQVLAMMGNSPITTADQFSYTAGAPQVTGVSPNSGSTTGGNSVSISGSGFSSGVSAVLFGTTNASSFSVMGDGTINAQAPAHATGNVDVIVVTSAGSSAVVPAHDQYSFMSTGPTITGVSPNTGSGSGGTSVTITGTGFNNVSGLTFGGTNAGSFTVNSPTSITAVAPAHTAGTVDIVVSASGGTSATGSADQFVYTAPVLTPAVTGLGTTSGTTAGGTQVVILGANFNNVSGVMFGGMAAASYTVNSPTSITAVTAAESAGVIDVRVANSAGTSQTSAADQFTFQSPAPVVANLNTTSGTTAGGTSVTINGSNFMQATGVCFGTIAAQFTINSPTSITAYAPAHAAGTVDVTVRNSGGTSSTSASDQYTFVTPGALPTVSRLSVTTGPNGGGTTLVITGTNFSNVTAVSFGNVPASDYTVQSQTSILAQAPAGIGTVDVTVTTSSGTSASSSNDQFTYGAGSGTGDSSAPAPVVFGLDTTTGPAAGGTLVMVLGTGFLGASGVSFGSVAASSFTVVSDSVISAVTPAAAQAAGLSALVDVTVTTPAGTSSTSADDEFTYNIPGNAPTLTGLDVTQGAAAGGTVVTISGTNFNNVSGVSFGPVAATQILVASSTSIVAVAPAVADAPNAPVDITVTTDAGTTAASPADQFTYVAAATSGSAASGAAAPPAPAITGLSISSGRLAGGDTVTISGSNLAGTTAVLFGNVAAASFFLNSDGTITAVVPPLVRGGQGGSGSGQSDLPFTVDVTVQTTNGASPVTPADQFTFAAPPSPPTVTGLSASVGSIGGGALITIRGSNLTQVIGVAFGGRAAASFTANSDGTITAVAPAEPAGLVDVTVTTTGGTSAAVAADLFTFSSAVPIVTGLSTSSGSDNGSDAVTISGANLSTATGVFFGGVAAQSFTTNDDGTITAVTPSWPTLPASAVDVIVQNALAMSAPSKADRFTVTSASALPTVAALSTTSGPAGGGGLIMVTGTNFTNVSGVSFGGIACGFFQALSATTLVARVPAVGQVSNLSAPVDVTVTTPAGTSAATSSDLYSYTATASAPVVISLSAASGYTTGGETLTIFGRGFTGATAVLFGGVAAASFSVASDGMITAVTPAVVGQVSDLSGPVDVTVQTPSATSATNPQDQFTFTPAGALPSVTALSAESGSTYGGQTFTIKGTNFTDVSSVSFGTVAAASFTVTSPTSIRVTAPALAVGTYDVKVTTPTGTSALSVADQFTSTVAPPAVTGLSTASGFTSGGDTVTITGTDLSQATAVYFGNTAATSFTINADGSLTAIVPNVGQVSNLSAPVTVVTPGGRSPMNSSTHFTFTPAGALSTVTALDISSGPMTGGQTITITGTNFTDVTSVHFGNVAATSFAVDSPTSLTVVTPSAGQVSNLSGTPVDVTVTTSAGSSATSTADQFTFEAPAPLVTSLSESSGFSDGGDSVVISGLYLDGATAVYFGTTAATSFAINANGTITAISPAVEQASQPASSLTIDITVVTPAGASSITPTDQYTFIPAGALPTVESLSVSDGSTDGGDIVTITGANFTHVTGVSFGGIAADSFIVDSPTRITAYSPAVGQVSNLSETVDVTVTTSAGSSTTSAADLFTFTSPAPVITGLSDSSGFASGGDSITIRGSDLSDATAVYFGSVAATSFTASPDGTITAVIPPLVRGGQGGSASEQSDVPFTIDIRVVTPSGSTGSTPSDQFTFTPDGAAPTVTALSTASGSTAGEQSVVITGTNFTGVTGVSFGGQAAGLYYVVSPTSIVAISPSVAAGTSYVTVTSTAGTSAGSSASQYSATAPSSSGTGDSSGANADAAGPGTTTPGSYVVVPWNGPPVGALGAAWGTAAWSATGGQSDLGFLLPPTDPYLNPILTASESGPIGDMTSTWTLTDGGTKVMSMSMTMTQPNGGGTTFSFSSDTLTFNYSAGGTSHGGSSDSYANLTANDVQVNFSRFTAADGTGCTHFDMTSTQTVITYTDHSVSTGDLTPPDVTIHYNATASGVQSFSDHQDGASSVVSGGRATEDDSGSATSNANFTGSDVDGALNSQFGGTAAGSDKYNETDTLNAPGVTNGIQTANDTLSGFDGFSKGQGGTYSKAADGTINESGWARDNGWGNDLYSDQETQIVATIGNSSGTGDSSFSTGSGTGASSPATQMIDFITDGDVGTDRYTAFTSTDTTTNPDGPVTVTDSHNNTDSGTERVLESDRGLVTEDDNGPDGSSTVASDSFNDASDDTSSYSDSDVGSSSGRGDAEFTSTRISGTDKLASTDDDRDKFSSGDAPKVMVTSVAPAGAVTTVGISGNDSDSGTARAHDDISDDETLPTATTGETDKFKFDDSASEKDTEIDGATININSHGLLKANDNIDLTETITLGDVTKTTQGFDDPGTETDAPTGDVESDKLTENSDVKDNLRITEKLQSVETTTAADGTVTTNTLDDGFVETSQDEQTDNLKDQHTDNGNGTDDETFDDEETSGDQIQGNDTVGVSTYGPVNISASFGQPAGTGTLYTSNVIGDNYTASDGDTNDDNGEQISSAPDAGPAGGEVIGGGGPGSEHDTDTDTSFAFDKGDEFTMSSFNETLTDPLTGVRTIIGTDDFVDDKFKDNENDHETDKHHEGSGSGDGSGNDDVTGNDRIQTEDDTLNFDDADISITGSPSAGVTESINDDITLSGSGEDDFQETDEGEDTNVPGVISFAANSSSGSSSGATDEETDDVVDETTSQETIGINDNSTITTIDPTTGLTTTDTTVNGGKINVGDEESDLSTDDYTYGESTDPPGEGEDDITDHADDQETVNGKMSSTDTTNVTGTLPDGTTINSTETVGDKVTANAYTDDNKQTTGTDLSNGGGQDTSDSSQTTDNTYDDANVTDTETDAIQSTISTTDATTGLQVTFALEESCKNTTTDTDQGDGADTSTYASGSITPGIAPTGTTTDTNLGAEDDFSETGNSINHLKLVQTTAGKDLQGNQVNLQNTATLDDTENIDGSNVDSESADGTQTDVSGQDETTNVRVTDFTGGTIVTVDPVTGIKTTVVLNDLISGTAQDEEDQSANSEAAANGAATGTSSDTDSGSETSRFNIQDTIIQTNPDGSPVGPAAVYAGSDSDTQTELNGVWTDQGNTDSLPVAFSGGALPAVSSVVAAGATSAQGSTNGGDVVIVTGSNFTSDSQVAFDGTPAQSSIVVSQSEIIAVSPSHVAASVHITVTSAAGTSATSPADKFDFQSANTNAPPSGGAAGTGSTGGNGSSAQPITGADKYNIQLQIGEWNKEIMRLAKVYKAAPNAAARQDAMQKLISAATQAYQLSGQIGQDLDINATIDRHLNGLGDEARNWSLAQRYYETLKYAYQHGQFGDEIEGQAAQIGQLLNVLENPEALAEFAGMMALGFAIKRGVCAAGKGSFVGPLATIALGAGEVAALSIRIGSLTSQLNTISTKGEVADYSKDVAAFTVDMIKDHVFLAWIKKFVCFPAGTPVVVGRDGDRLITRPIETLRPGDKVLAREEYGSGVELCPIVSVSVRKAGSLVHVRFRGADEQIHTITCTPGHPFWVAERAGYVSADELLPGDTLTGPDGGRLTFISSEREDLRDAIPVYNFEVAVAHTYFVTPVCDTWTAVLVHNGLVRCSGDDVPDGTQPRGPSLGAQQGRQFRPDQLELYEFDKFHQPKHVRGWLQNERRRIAGTGGGGDVPRTPPGYVQSHGRATPAREGYDYSNSRLQGEDLNKLEERIRKRHRRP